MFIDKLAFARPTPTPEAAILTTILLIDCDPVRLRTTRRMLETIGYVVVVGSSAALATSLTRLHRPALLLLEAEISDGNAREVAKQLKLDSDLVGLFVVLFSGERISPQDQAADLTAGLVDGYLTRPLGEIEFLARIEDFLRIRTCQELLRESEKRYRAHFISTRNGFALHSITRDERGLPCDCRFLEVNPAFENLTGLSSADIIGRPLLEVIPGIQSSWAEVYGEVALSGKTVHFETFFDKRQRYCQVEAYSPKPGQLATIFTDVTDRIWSEEGALAEEELKLKSFTLDNLAEEVIWLTADGLIWDANQVACENLGYTREELLLLSIADIDPLYSKEAWLPHWKKLKRLGSLQFESLHKNKSGRAYPVEIMANYLNHNGLEYNCAIVRDISERKNLEKALQDSEEQFRTLCDFAPIGIFRSDGEGNNIYGNPRWEEISGMSALEGAGKGWRAAIYPDDWEELARIWQEAAARGRIFSHEHRQLTPRGKTIWVRALASPIRRQDGTVLGHVGTLEDITELRQARQEILKAQKLESIGVLAGGIAHDFNNILTAILGNISLARYQMQDPEKVLNRLDEAESAAVRAKDLTQQLLTFARGGEPVKRVIEVSKLLKEAVGFVLHGSNVRCEFAIADDVWPLEVDEGQLIQVVHNIALNAVQAMPEGGTVTISAANVGSRQQGEGFVQILVADTGAGIAEQHLQRIFDPYFTTKQQGSGLGLASCYSIIKKHGGTITIESTLGQGSTFHIVLPASNQPQISVPPTPSAISHGSSRVLVMDDEEIIRVLARIMLEELGYQAQCVENGSQAAEVYLKNKEEGTPFFATILDLTVPGGVGGKEAIQMLLKIDPQVKAIVSSGYSADPVMANYREYGFSAVLGKPYRLQDLSKILRELLVV